MVDPVIEVLDNLTMERFRLLEALILPARLAVTECGSIAAANGLKAALVPLDANERAIRHLTERNIDLLKAELVSRMERWADRRIKAPVAP